MDGPSPNNNNYYDQPPQAAPLTTDPNFDILDWHPAYQSCQRYFLDHAQHEPATQALAALINIRLPFQYLNNPIASSTPGNHASSSLHSPSQPPPQQQQPNYQFNFPRPTTLNANSTTTNPTNQPTSNSNNPTSPSTRSRSSSAQPTQPFISLIPYLKRLVITGFDKPPILHGLFGDDYPRGILPHLDCERRNYLFAAKHGGWRSCKKQYDMGSGMGGDECVPFMKPLDEAKVEELMAAEKAWSQWLAMEDWMVGPRAPGEEDERGGGLRMMGDERRGDGMDGGAVQGNGNSMRMGGVENGGLNQLPDGVAAAFPQS